MSKFRVGVIGYPIEHSLSPVMHNAAFAALGMSDWLYDAMAIPPDILRYGLREPRNHGYIGINVTVPHKEAIMELLQPDEIARAVGAVNTVDFRDNSGTNTDVAGLVDDLRAHGIPITNQRILVLGAGGAARAAAYGLARAKAEVAIVNRTKSRAERLVADLKSAAGIDGIALMTLEEAAQWGMSLIINCTSVGLHPHVNQSPWIDGLPFPADITVYDTVYRPAETALMRQCLAQGGRAISGLGMLARQGARSFEIWTGVAPPVDVMLGAAQGALQNASKI